jgi:hypothetical protein
MAIPSTPERRPAPYPVSASAEHACSKALEAFKLAVESNDGNQRAQAEEKLVAIVAANPKLETKVALVKQAILEE